MFIDQAKIEVRSGKGGDGLIAYLREKFRPNGGPAGGNGGRGASIYFRASKVINTLIAFRHSRTIIGEDGEKGGIKNQYGKGRDDVYIDVPVGTVIYVEPEHALLGDLDEDGKTILVCKGGRGGKGNAAFKTPTNKCPKIAENGEPGEIKKITLELKLLADCGLVGFPSVGKSTLLSLVSSARPEIADYPFTTLEPNLGVVATKDKSNSFVMADLPGLIEGAHLGKGLGLAFLRHIERCKVIVHLVSMDGERDPFIAYKAIRNELKSYGFGLKDRPEVIVATKMDEDGANERLECFKKKVKKPVIGISAYTEENVDKLVYNIADLLNKTEKFPLFEETGKETLKVYELPSLEKAFVITKVKEHRFEITGEKIIKFYKMTNISTDEGMLKLITHLRKIGVDDELEKMGAKDGDIVSLDDFEFEYYE